MGNTANLSLVLLTSFLIGACSDSIPSRVIALKPFYDGQDFTHARRWRSSYFTAEEDQCAFLYRDKRIDTKQDDWLPFFQGLALMVREEELNLRREENPMVDDSELFTRKEKVDYCKEIDDVEVGLDHGLNHYRVAIPRETRERLNQLLEEVRKTDPERSLDYLDNLKMSDDPTLF